MELIDDLDEKVAVDVARHTFALDGTEYEIDLTKANAAELSKAMANARRLWASDVTEVCGDERP